VKQIEVDDEVYGAIQAQAVPLEDDANSVLRRVFSLDGAGTPRLMPAAKAGRAAPGSILAEREYERPILEELLARGGKGQANEITDAVGARLAHKLTDLDRQQLDSGEIRWRNRVQFSRLTLKRRGLISSPSRGIWELTPPGRATAKRLVE
jgi:hypothetical protein